MNSIQVLHFILFLLQICIFYFKFIFICIHIDSLQQWLSPTRDLFGVPDKYEISTRSLHGQINMVYVTKSPSCVCPQFISPLQNHPCFGKAESRMDFTPRKKPGEWGITIRISQPKVYPKSFSSLLLSITQSESQLFVSDSQHQ